MNRMLLYPVIIGIILGTAWWFLETIRMGKESSHFDVFEIVTLIFIGCLMVLLDAVIIDGLLFGFLNY